jgi:hypothetical protein
MISGITTVIVLAVAVWESYASRRGRAAVGHQAS